MQGRAVGVLSETGAFGRKSSAGNKSSSVRLQGSAFSAGQRVAHELLVAASGWGWGLGGQAGDPRGLTRAHLPPGSPPAASTRRQQRCKRSPCWGRERPGAGGRATEQICRVQGAAFTQLLLESTARETPRVTSPGTHQELPPCPAAPLSPRAVLAGLAGRLVVGSPTAS